MSRADDIKRKFAAQNLDRLRQATTSMGATGSNRGTQMASGLLSQAQDNYRSLGGQVGQYGYSAGAAQPMAGAGAGQGRVSGPPQVDLAADDRTIRDHTFGYKQDILDDSMLASAMKHYQNTLQQGGGPYSSEVVGAMQDQIDRGAAAQRSMARRNIERQAEMQGLQPGDPAYGSAMNAANVNEYLRRAGGYNDITAQAALGNYGAQTQAAGSLTSGRLAQLQTAGQYGLKGVDYLNQPVTTGAENMPGTYAQWAQQYAGGAYPGHQPNQDIASYADLATQRNALARQATDTQRAYRG